MLRPTMLTTESTPTYYVNNAELSCSQYEFGLAVGRLPLKTEKQLATRFLTSNSASLKEFALAVFNLNAFLYVD